MRRPYTQRAVTWTTQVRRNCAVKSKAIARIVGTIGTETRLIVFDFAGLAALPEALR